MKPGELIQKHKEKRIYIFDDQKIIRLDLERRLRAIGFENVQHFGIPEEAIKNTDIGNPELIITDDTMYGPMNGPELIDYYKGMINIPIIGLGTFYLEWWFDCSKEHIMDAYILKPFKERELYTTICLLLEKYYNKA